jgi:hypothetical protein
MRIKESDWRYLVDALLFVCLIGMVFVGVLLGLVLSEGPVSSGGSKYFLGLHRHQWGDIHAYLSIAFVILMAVHLVLSWKWIKAKTRQIFKRGATPALAVIGGLPVAVLFLFWIWTPRDSESFRSYGVGAGERRVTPRAQLNEAPLSVEKSVRHDDLRRSERPTEQAVEAEHFPEEDHHAQVGSITITGRQTLRDLENATSIPAGEIVKRMGLPERTSLDETLGRLRRLYGFEIQEVRDQVAQLLKERQAGRD